MIQSLHPYPVNTSSLEAVVNKIFPASEARVERVLSGISTYVYRILFQDHTYYLRILPEAEASLCPEFAVLTLLRENHVSVPEVVYFEEYNPILGRPIMIENEIKGQALSQSALSRKVFLKVAREAGRELARINRFAVDGFGWMRPDPTHSTRLHAGWSTYRDFLLEYREADLAFLGREILKPQESALLERVLARYDFWLDEEQGFLAHGDLDTTHLFQDRGRYTGIIDFGEVRGTSRWYDLAHFRIRDGVRPSYQIFPALERGYREIAPLPAAEYEEHLRFTSVLINIRALSRAFQTRPPDGYIWRQLEVLREDLAVLS